MLKTLGNNTVNQLYANKNQNKPTLGRCERHCDRALGARAVHPAGKHRLVEYFEFYRTGTTAPVFKEETEAQESTNYFPKPHGDQRAAGYQHTQLGQERQRQQGWVVLQKPKDKASTQTHWHRESCVHSRDQRQSQGNTGMAGFFWISQQKPLCLYTLYT